MVWTLARFVLVIYVLMTFIITRMFIKIFQTSSVDVVKDCQTMFNFRRVSELVLDRKRKFLQKFCSCDNIM